MTLLLLQLRLLQYTTLLLLLNLYLFPLQLQSLRLLARQYRRLQHHHHQRTL